MTEALGVVEGRHEGGGGDGPAAGDGAQALHALIVSADPFDHLVGVRELSIE